MKMAPLKMMKTDTYSNSSCQQQVIQSHAAHANAMYSTYTIVSVSFFWVAFCTFSETKSDNNKQLKVWSDNSNSHFVESVKMV